MQRLPDGNVMIGWGAEPYYTEFQSDGAMVLDAKFAEGLPHRRLPLRLERDAHGPARGGGRHDEAATRRSSRRGTDPPRRWRGGCSRA